MATYKGIPEGIGLEGSKRPRQAKGEIYHSHITPAEWDDEYSTPAMRLPNPVQHGYPAKKSKKKG
jgi:hypothetical protein